MVKADNIFHIEKVVKWSEKEDELLLRLAKSNRRNNWIFISSKMENKSPDQCKSRFNRIRTDIKKGYWTREEDEKLLNLYDIIGPSWSKIALMIKNREGKQVRDRYINIIGENCLKNKFSEQEDFKLFLLHKFYGNKWTFFSSHLSNRSPDNIKNRFNSTVLPQNEYFESLIKNKQLDLNKFIEEIGNKFAANSGSVNANNKSWDTLSNSINNINNCKNNNNFDNESNTIYDNDDE